MVAICQPMQTLAIKARLTSYQAMNSNKSRRRNQKTKNFTKPRKDHRYDERAASLVSVVPTTTGKGISIPADTSVYEYDKLRVCHSH